ncbi:MAG: hypothetical protein PHX70_02770 [Clostridium sp.]|nr:hypothetical protein [Clostridium sp.]
MGVPNEKRYKRSDEEQKSIIEKIDENQSWIIEGTYCESQQYAYDLLDKIIFLDTSLYKRKFRIITRFIKQKIGVEKSNYIQTFEMLKCMFKWTNDFDKNRQTYESRLLNYKDKLIWIKSKKELDGRL